MKKIAIIGGGASGMLAAIKIKQELKDKVDVTIFERNKRLGKKLAMSGNGRGNLSNRNVSADKYNNPNFVKPLLDNYDSKKLQDYFLSLGLLSKVDAAGRVYPYSENANNVVDILRNKIEHLGIKVVEDEIDKVSYDANYIIKKEHYDYLIIAAGSGAGSNEKINPLAQSIKDLGHNFTRLFPGLSPIPSDNKYLSSVRGVRVDAKTYLYIENKLIHEEEGEVLFKDDALSGIVIFNQASYYSRYLIDNGLTKAKLVVDFFKDYEEKDLEKLIIDQVKANDGRDSECILKGFLNKMLVKMILGTISDSKANFAEPGTLAHMLKHFEFEVDYPKNFANAQVVCGGVRSDEVDKLTFESKKKKNLFFGGEILDIDGECGGYNLHFAFATGLNIANTIIKREVK